ncbi:MAG: heavy metal translocating P-type ATPase [Candidatus Marinimicrobia bacterium]|jgi:Cu+-exporting ATPase|nr:heavy metal translocating P-type ATPase [Candidatus Neomarinimicrobiota bacterium]MDP6821165.1 heavy metal translocating P-type ATPase [Candidatus Neomarinimicrobiota bacterium]MDP6861635.1 heavy metal translocating P-type ATPase [Candidatus Neomarinimicrobiota bacterium]|tara:strand:- start:107 stop:2299 length:2193 start_codon:yes stop_codon:yes gene_type:complete
MMVVELKITGMHCAGCVASVENALRKVEGVEEAVVTLTLEKATVLGSVDPTQLIQSVDQTGYSAEIIDGGTGIDIQEKIDEKVELAFSHMKLAWIFTLPAMIWMSVHMAIGVAWPSLEAMDLGIFILSSVVCFFPGRGTMTSAWKSAIHFTPNMDVLIALGSLAALFTGIIKSYVDIHSFAGIAGMIMSFHLTGRYIETKARGRSSEAIQKLMNLGAKQAAVLDMEGNEVKVDVRSLVVDQIMIVRAGESIPTDGIVVEGSAAVDESMVSGESLPVMKRANDLVIGGTICADSTLRVKVSKIGQDTFLAKVIQMVEQAQTTRVPIQIFADKVVAVFVPVVLVLALITFFFWTAFPNGMKQLALTGSGLLPWTNPELSSLGMALYATIAVLVIACPCALGLATPMALMVGSGLGAENGILIRDGAAIQRLNEVNTILFDKTGTLTEGKPAVVKVHQISGIGGNDLIRMAASLERESTHPLAQAIMKLAEEKELELDPVSDVEVVSGKGISGNYGSSILKVGSASFTNSNPEIDLSGTPVFLTLNNELIGVFEIEDTIRPDSADTIARLRRSGYRCVLVTGDRKEIADALAADLNIDQVHSEVLPDEKATIVESYQKTGKTVAMVGDGINDAPAIAQADVGIALGSGTDIAMETGEIVLTKGDLNAVLQAIRLANVTFKKIKQNLFWAFIYNVIAIPIAFAGVLHPVIAEVAMAFSSINVIGNSNRLKSIRL